MDEAQGIQVRRLKKFRFKVDTTLVYEVEAEDEADLRLGVEDGGYLSDKNVVDVWSGPDMWDVEELPAQQPDAG